MFSISLKLIFNKEEKYILKTFLNTRVKMRNPVLLTTPIFICTKFEQETEEKIWLALLGQWTQMQER